MKVSPATLIMFLLLTPTVNLAQDDMSHEAELTRSRKDEFVNSSPTEYRSSPSRKVLSKEAKQLLSVPPELQFAQYRFLQAKHTGIAKLLPRDQYKQQISFRGGGAYFDFQKRSAVDTGASDIYLWTDSFFTGKRMGAPAFWSSADIGIIARLGDKPIEEDLMQLPEAQLLQSYVPPNNLQTVQQAHHQFIIGTRLGDSLYRASAIAEENTTYLLRTIRYGQSDQLLAFRTLRREADGSFVIIWKRLREYSTPRYTVRPTTIK